MHLLRLLLTAAVTVVAVSNGISANANEITRATTAKSTLIHDAVPSLQVATRELSDEDAALEERRGVAAGGHARGGGGVTTGGDGGGGGVTTGGDGGGGVTTGGDGGGGVTTGGDGGGGVTTEGGVTTGGDGGGGYTATRGGFVNGAPTITRSNTTTELNTTTGLNTIGVTHYKEKKCNRILNWWKRLFSDKIKECPEEEEEDTSPSSFRRKAVASTCKCVRGDSSMHYSVLGASFVKPSCNAI
ncbi:hypothetical protein PC121_g6559 [Phytophthora cactorum]|nr:hypothetical protein PC120_g25888 [Phytophthora cactorum]KAG3081181.1 hypothetical protein PC121_g6559 [Phytophthora cactorum]